MVNFISNYEKTIGVNMKSYLKLIKALIKHIFDYLPVILLKGLGYSLAIGFFVEILFYDVSAYLTQDNILNILFVIFLVGAIVHFFQMWKANK